MQGSLVNLNSNDFFTDTTFFLFLSHKTNGSITVLTEIFRSYIIFRNYGIQLNNS